MGHTQNEGDSCHSLIERNIQRYLRSSPVYVPGQYATLVGTAKKLVNLSKFMNLTHVCFWYLKELIHQTVVNFNLDENAENGVCVVKLYKQYPNKYFYKTSYINYEFRSVDVKTNKTRKFLKKF